MKANKAAIFSLFLSAMSLAACSNSQNPAAQAAVKLQKSHFYLRYVDSKKELQAEARLLADTGQVYLPAGIFLAGKDSEAERLNGQKQPKGWVHKLIKENMPFNPPFLLSFEYNGQTVKHSLSCPNVQNLRLGSGSISEQNGGLLVWDGQPFGETDLVRIIITDSQGQTLTLNHAGKTSSNELPLPYKEIKGLAKGKAQINLSFQHTELSQGEQELQKTVEFYCRTIETELK